MTMNRILIADDDDLFGEMIQKTLTTFSYEVARVRNGKEALRIYDPKLFDLVLTDLIMPDMEGVELILALRKVHPAVKVIAMSGGGRNQPEAYLSIARRVGAVQTLAKPFPLEELLQAVKDALASP